MVMLFLLRGTRLAQLGYKCDKCRHDVGLQIVGQPARDLGRHFVQR